MHLRRLYQLCTSFSVLPTLPYLLNMLNNFATEKISLLPKLVLCIWLKKFQFLFIAKVGNTCSFKISLIMQIVYLAMQVGFCELFDQWTELNLHHESESNPRWAIAKALDFLLRSFLLCSL